MHVLSVSHDFGFYTSACHQYDVMKRTRFTPLLCVKLSYSAISGIKPLIATIKTTEKESTLYANGLFSLYFVYLLLILMSLTLL